MKIAFYRGKGDTVREWLVATAIQLITNGPYSHVELIDDSSEQWEWYSSSILDGGVRSKKITPRPGRWDIFEIDSANSKFAISFIKDQIGEKYDWFGLFACSFMMFSGSKDKWFCSEIVTAALDNANIIWISPEYDDPARYSPNRLFHILKNSYNSLNSCEIL